jgi:hypothetical protein
MGLPSFELRMKPVARSLFAVSVDKQLLGGNMVWLVMTGIGVAGVYVTGKIKGTK